MVVCGHVCLSLACNRLETNKRKKGILFFLIPCFVLPNTAPFLYKMSSSLLSSQRGLTGGKVGFLVAALFVPFNSNKKRLDDDPSNVFADSGRHLTLVEEDSL